MCACRKTTYGQLLEMFESAPQASFGQLKELYRFGDRCTSCEIEVRDMLHDFQSGRLANPPWEAALTTLGAASLAASSSLPRSERAAKNCPAPRRTLSSSRTIASNPCSFSPMSAFPRIKETRTGAASSSRLCSMTQEANLWQKAITRWATERRATIRSSGSSRSPNSEAFRGLPLPRLLPPMGVGLAAALLSLPGQKG